jgi:pilus assembly protein FimV
VLKSFVKVLMAVAGLMWAGLACAVGFGSANVASALGQPLKVDIALKDVSGSNAVGLSAHLASPDAFKAAGLDYPYHLARLKFEIVTRNDQAYIEITSKEPVNDSFINLLVELTWNSGKLLREYTFLLDPPDYHAEMPKGEPVAPIEPVVAAPAQPPEAPAVAPLTPGEAASAPAVTAEPVQPAGVVAASAPAAGETEEAAAAASAPSAAPAASAEEQTEVPPAAQPAAETQAAPRKAAPETIKVKRGDTLSKIAARVMQPDVTLEQMLVALYRANARQFDGRNMNRIRAGKILRMPDADAFDHLSNREAAKEIRIQTANWNAYRQKLAASGAAVSEQPKQGASGKISTEVVDKTPVKKPGNGGTLEISRGEAPGAGGKVPAGPQAKEEAVVKQKTVAENEQRAAQLEKQIQDMNKVQEMKKGSVINLKGGVQPPSAVAGKPAVSASAVGQARPKVAKAPPAPEPSLLDSVLSPITDSDLAKEYPMLQDPLYLAGGLGVVVVLIGGGVYLVRRRASGGGRSPKKKKIGK